MTTQDQNKIAAVMEAIHDAQVQIQQREKMAGDALPPNLKSDLLTALAELKVVSSDLLIYVKESEAALV